MDVTRTVLSECCTKDLISGIVFLSFKQTGMPPSLVVAKKNKIHSGQVGANKETWVSFFTPILISPFAMLFTFSDISLNV